MQEELSATYTTQFSKMSWHVFPVVMAQKFETPQTQADYRQRKWLAEPPDGWIKSGRQRKHSVGVLG